MARTPPEFLIDTSAFSLRQLKSNEKPCLDCTDSAGKDSHHLQYFIDKRASKNQYTHLGVTYLITYKNKTIGYITVAASNINKDKISAKARPSTRDSSLFPALTILSFCIDKKLRRKGFGEYVLEWCTGLARKISATIGCRYIMLFTKDLDVIKFYTKHNYYLNPENVNKKNEFKLMYLDLFPELKK